MICGGGPRETPSPSTLRHEVWRWEREREREKGNHNFSTNPFSEDETINTLFPPQDTKKTDPYAETGGGQGTQEGYLYGGCLKVVHVFFFRLYFSTRHPYTSQWRRNFTLSPPVYADPHTHPKCPLSYKALWKQIKTCFILWNLLTVNSVRVIRLWPGKLDH